MSEFDQLLESIRADNVERKRLHPDWPSHKPTTYFPDGTVEVSESVPVWKINRCRAYCKYCYDTHSNWWMMDQRDYHLVPEEDDPPIILCGRCEHTSRADFAELSRKHWQQTDGAKERS